MNVVIFIYFFTIEAKESNTLCNERGTRLVYKNNKFDPIMVSKAKGGLAWIASFGETRVEIESTNSPISVIRSGSKLESIRNDRSYVQMLMNVLFEDAKRTYRASWNPFEDHFLRVEPKGLSMFTTFNEEVCYKARLRMFSASRVLPLIFGLVLFFNAKHLSRNITFHYGGGILSGVVLASFAALFLIARLLPMKRSALLSLWIGGSSLIMWFGNKFQSQAAELIQSYPWVASIYVLIAAGFSFFCCFWFEDNLKNPKFQKAVCWILQLLGLGLIFISSWKLSINFTIITVLLVREFFIFSAKYSANWTEIKNKISGKESGDSPMFCTPAKTTGPRLSSTPRSNFFSPLRFLQPRQPPNPKRFLTIAEYEEQARIETEHSLELLKKQVNASEQPIKLLGKLSRDTQNKIINFANGGNHLDEDVDQMNKGDSSSDDEFSDEEICKSPSVNLNRTCSPNHTSRFPPPRDNRSTTLRRQVLQRNTSRPTWK